MLWFPLSNLLMSIFLEAAAKMFGKKLFCRRVELETILRFGKAMALIGEEHILIVYALAFHRLDDLFGLSLFHAWIIRSLRDEHGDFHLVDFEKRRPRF